MIGTLGPGKLWTPAGSIVLPPARPADVHMAGCNTVVEDTNRDINPPVAPSANVVGPTETWYFQVTNPAHDPLGRTNACALACQFGAGATVGLADFAALCACQPNPPGAPFSTFGVVGQFTTPLITAGSHFLFTAGAGYAVGLVTVDECWAVDLWKIAP